ncbi:aminoglycoside 6'-acetyltransferase [Novosphingobium fuchskuhlense]|uniref:Aminoglycoside N(6')-acetyltransferase type 1 n=1 Tax=Novosphingobium fuchskuhlense TaxID=1117702 RepID=A0A117USQ5_9SPHN|nr:aminoglycoside 6'-N-acetyltransferase [Novosphingobium fuchskuhlense]KUR70123.1 aminoglycoside 6'-acetyltransferase [Novosphingobium fuchskuhlense]
MTLIVLAGPEHLDGWAKLRHALWDEEPVVAHREEAEEQLTVPERFLNLVALHDGAVVGFAEASIRHEYVNGCEDSPVLFLEGIFVAPEVRRQGLARRLVAAVADWGRARGCREFASDAWHDDRDSHAFHLAAGFAETERVVYFRQEL